MKSGERETYLPGSGYNEGSSNNGSGHGGFPLLMFVPFSLFFSGSLLVRPLFLGLFVPCSCFQSLLFFFLLSFSVFCVCFSSVSLCPAFGFFLFLLSPVLLFLLCFLHFFFTCPAFSLGSLFPVFLQSFLFVSFGSLSLSSVLLLFSSFSSVSWLPFAPSFLPPFSSFSLAFIKPENVVIRVSHVRPCVP